MEQRFFYLGEAHTRITLSTLTSNTPGLTYFLFSPSEDIEEGFQDVLKTYGGRLCVLQNTDVTPSTPALISPLISFRNENKTWYFDPRSIFTRAGIEMNLCLNSDDTPDDSTLDQVEGFASWLLGYLIGQHSVFEVAPLSSHNGSECLLHTTDDRTRYFFQEAGYRTEDPSLTPDGTLADLWSSQRLHHVKLSVRDMDTKTLGAFGFLRRLYTTSLPQEHMAEPPISWVPLKEHDTVDLVAPSQAYKNELVPYWTDIFAECGLTANIIYADNTPDELNHGADDRTRAEHFYRALAISLRNPASKAVMGILEGGGATRLLPILMSKTPPIHKKGAKSLCKPFIGCGDLTSLHLLMGSVWNFSSLHGVNAGRNKEMFDTGLITDTTNKGESLKDLLSLLKQENPRLTYEGLKLLPSLPESQDTFPQHLETTLFGGSLTSVVDALPTPFHCPQKPFTLIIEEVGRSVRHVERCLDALRYSNLMQSCQAVIIGTLLRWVTSSPGEDPEFNIVQTRFSELLDIPVFSWPYFGRGKGVNRPLPLNTRAQINKETEERYTLTVDIR